MDCQVSTFHSPDLSHPVTKVRYASQCGWKVANLGKRYKDFRYFTVRFGALTTVTHIIIYTLGCPNKVLNVSVYGTNDGRSFLFYTSVSIQSFGANPNFLSACNSRHFRNCFNPVKYYLGNPAAMVLGCRINTMFCNLHHLFSCHSQ